MTVSSLDIAPAATAPAGTAALDLTVVVPCYNERANVVPLVAALDAALAGLAWEVVFVDDDSPDGTAAEIRRLAQSDPRLRCLRRIGRRGLASAVIEGALASSAAAIAVMDGDLQHDPAILPAMLRAVRPGGADIAVGSRHAEGGDAVGLASRWRRWLSGAGIRLAQAFLPARLSDPMSGFFVLSRPLFERLAPRLTGQGFKILLDLVLTAGPGLRVIEFAYHFRPREAGASKLDVLVLTQFAGLMLDRLVLRRVLGGLVPLRFVSFALVGALGVLVHVAVLEAAWRALAWGFTPAQVLATLAAMAFNFALNNQITYRDQMLRGALFWQGLGLFVVVCGIGAVANVGIARALYAGPTGGLLAGATGAAIGVVWNYAVSATLVWRAR
jgi:dolichol-phosphate mannosyltransferase